MVPDPEMLKDRCFVTGAEDAGKFTSCLQLTVAVCNLCLL